MAKRYGNSFENSFMRKKPKLDIVKTISSPSKDAGSSTRPETKEVRKLDNLDDSLFEDCEINLEEIDFISSQHTSEKNMKSGLSTAKNAPANPFIPTPSTSNGMPRNSSDQNPSSTSFPSKNPPTTIGQVSSSTSVAGNPFGRTSTNLSNGKNPLVRQDSQQQKLTNNVNKHSEAIPSTSKGNSFGNACKPNGDAAKQFQEKFSNVRNGKHTFQPSQKLASSEFPKDFCDDDELTAEEFKKNLMKNKNLNSTFFHKTQQQSTKISDEKSKEHVELSEKYKKLIDDMNQRDGENMYLRKQLEQTQSKLTKLNNEKHLLIEEHNKKLNQELAIKMKEIESLKTQNDLNVFQLKQMTENRKASEAKAIKFKTPQPISMAESPKFGSFRTKSMKGMSMNSTQTDGTNNNNRFCINKKIYCPFNNIPSTIFDTSKPIKPIVDIEVPENVGLNLIYVEQKKETDDRPVDLKDKSVCYKPTETIIDEMPLNVSFVILEISDLKQVLTTELYFDKTFFIINKIVATARELLLNLLNDLEMIVKRINNDEIKLMDGIYYSNLYDAKLDHNKSSCEADEWHEKERAIEARRLVEMLGIIAEQSDYLCNYITNKKQLNLTNDTDYHCYITKMTRYNLWSKQGHAYEILELILDVATAINTTRRAHQFTGLIHSIARLLVNVQRNVGFSNSGLNYVKLIFKELVFSRPLLRALISVAELMAEFKWSEIFINFITNSPNKEALVFVKNRLNFTKDACVLNIFTRQLMRFHYDEVTIVELTFALTSFIYSAFRSELIPWTSCASNSCAEFIRYFVKKLATCIPVDIEKVKDKFSSNHKLDDHYWNVIKRKHFYSIQYGLKFLTFVTKQDAEFLVTSDIESSFILLVKNASLISDPLLQDIKKRALVKFTSFFLNKSFQEKAHEDNLSDVVIRMTRVPLIMFDSSEESDHQENVADDDKFIKNFDSTLHL